MVGIYEFPTLVGEPFYGMPGLVADSLPDRFGNAVIEQWLMSFGKSLSDFTAIIDYVIQESVEQAL